MSDTDKAKLAKETYHVLPGPVSVCRHCVNREAGSKWCKVLKWIIDFKRGTCRVWEGP